MQIKLVEVQSEELIQYYWTTEVCWKGFFFFNVRTDCRHLLGLLMHSEIQGRLPGAVIWPLRKQPVLQLCRVSLTFVWLFCLLTLFPVQQQELTEVSKSWFGSRHQLNRSVSTPEQVHYTVTSIKNQQSLNNAPLLSKSFRLLIYQLGFTETLTVKFLRHIYSL